MNSNEKAQAPGAPIFSDDAIRRFLLGQLNSREQAEFEERLFTDTELETRVRLAEYELSDDCAYERLSVGDLESFRQKFLLTSDRNRKLHVSRALQGRFASPSITKPSPAISERLKSFFDLKQPAWKYAFAGLILLLIFATVLLVTKEPRIAIKLIPKRFQPRPAATATPKETHHTVEPPSPTHAEQYPPTQPHESPALESTLNPRTGLAQAPVINLPTPETAVVRFLLSIESSQAREYRADLETISGDVLVRVESLKPSNPNSTVVYFDVQRQTLKSGDYQIKLSRTDDGSSAPVATYYFRAQ